MAKGIRALLDTVMQALPQVGNLGLLFFLLFFIFAALGVELFGRLGKYTYKYLSQCKSFIFTEHGNFFSNDQNLKLCRCSIKLIYTKSVQT